MPTPIIPPLTRPARSLPGRSSTWVFGCWTLMPQSPGIPKIFEGYPVARQLAVGNSRIGIYYGKYGFDSLAHAKSHKLFG
jgi:hypothetical protein